MHTLTDLDDHAKKGQELAAELRAKGLSPEKIAAASQASSTVRELLNQLAAKGLSPEEISKVIDAQQAEPLPPISLDEPTLAEISAKLDDVLTRLDRIESRLAE